MDGMTLTQRTPSSRSNRSSALCASEVSYGIKCFLSMQITMLTITLLKIIFILVSLGENSRKTLGSSSSLKSFMVTCWQGFGWIVKLPMSPGSVEQSWFLGKEISTILAVVLAGIYMASQESATEVEILCVTCNRQNKINRDFLGACYA